MRNALLVLTTDARIRAVLQAMDPKALAQADAALARTDHDLLVEIVGRLGVITTLHHLSDIAQQQRATR